MKKNVIRILTFVLIIALMCCLIPTFKKRIDIEEKNKNVIVSLYYNDIANRLRGEKLENAIEEFKKRGVTTMSFSEENINSMVARGDITNIKYNVLRHKYEDESIEMAELIAKEAPGIIYDSQLIITKNEETADFLTSTLPDRFVEDEEYKKVVYTNPRTDVKTYIFCLYDGTIPTNDIQLGYNEKAIKKYHDAGFDICLVMRFFDSSKTDYIDTMQEMIDKYENIKHISIRSATVGPVDETEAKEHYTKISKLIKDNDLTLVVTENANQLSNETPFGYKTIFNENSDKVMRSYETYDASQVEKTRYMFRYHQYLNSTIDRNIRFITISQIHLQYQTYEDCTEYTLKATEEYINKIKELGYTVNGEVPVLDYDTNLRIPNAIATAIMVLLVYLILLELTGFNKKFFFILCLIGAVIAAAVAFIMPQGYAWMFPTAWAVISPCFAITYVLIIVKQLKDKLYTVPLALIATGFLVGIMSLFGIVQSSLLSGINYYVNNDIFRGIKLSLFIPLVFAAVIFVLIFVKIDLKKTFKYITSIKISDIKLSYIVICLGLLFIAYSIISIYITRSGNVNSISSLEALMRNFITEIFEARPRTKEFLIGYPCLILFVYYIKKTKILLLQGLLFCGSAITAASISNTFCHVFTTVETIYGRVINGVIIGAVVCIFAYFANIVLVKIVSKLFNRYLLPIVKKSDTIYNIYAALVGIDKEQNIVD